jgi:hypothetical protein
MLIHVYQRHIDRGFRGKGCEMLCPIAIAMAEQLETKVGVWDGKAFIINTGQYYILPEQAVKNYLRYDRTGIMPAFDFEVGRLNPAKKREKKAEVKTATA